MPLHSQVTIGLCNVKAHAREQPVYQRSDVKGSVTPKTEIEQLNSGKMTALLPIMWQSICSEMCLNLTAPQTSHTSACSTSSTCLQCLHKWHNSSRSLLLTKLHNRYDSSTAH